MVAYSGEVGLQLTHIANRYTVPQWVELAELAHKTRWPVEEKNHVGALSQ